MVFAGIENEIQHLDDSSQQGHQQHKQIRLLYEDAEYVTKCQHRKAHPSCPLGIQIHKDDSFSVEPF